MTKILTFVLSFTLIISSLQAQEATRKFKSAFMSEAFQLYGYGQAIANYSENPARGQVRTTANSSIDLARVILFATGRLGANNRLGYMIMSDLGPNVALQELYGEWLPTKTFNVRFGQSKIPFTIENPMSPTRFETIYPSRSVSAMAGSSGDFNQYGANGAVSVKAGRDAGLLLYGQIVEREGFSLVEYYAGLYNGTGLNTKDNNNAKDIIATAYLQPLKGLKIGGSLYSGKLTIQDAVAGLAAGTHKRQAWAVGGVFDSRRFYARSEYVANRTGDIERYGYYATGVWKFVPGRWEALAKVDFFDSNCAVGRNETTDCTFGVNYIIAHLTRLQINYIHTVDRLQGDNNAAAVQMQVFF
jgi:hypothetical protein